MLWNMISFLCLGSQRMEGSIDVSGYNLILTGNFQYSYRICTFVVIDDPVNMVEFIDSLHSYRE